MRKHNFCPERSLILFNILLSLRRRPDKSAVEVVNPPAAGQLTFAHRGRSTHDNLCGPERFMYQERMKRRRCGPWQYRINNVIIF